MRKLYLIFGFQESPITIISAILLVIFITTFLLNTALSQTIDTLWIEDWENPNWPNDWHVSAGTWEVGNPTSGPNSAHSPGNCAATVLNGNYSEPVDSKLIRHISFIVPPSSDNPRLRFWHWYSFSSGDFGEVQISTDGGTTWETISPTYTNTGSGVWTYPFIDLSAYADSTVQIAYYFHSHRVGSFGNVSTGWYIDDIAVITGPIVFNNPENFESGIGDWAVDKGTWEVGEPTAGPGSSFSPPNCAATRLNGNYAEPVDSRLISPPLMVPNITQNPRLRFWHWYSFSSGDFGEVQISTDGGTTWETISPTYTNTGSGVWTYPFIDLSAYADSTVQIAYYFHSHRVGSFGNVSTGWYIDDIAVITGPIVFNNPENFESGIGDWAVDKGTWEVGEPTAGPGSSFSPPNCAATRLNGNYAEPVDSRLISPPFVVANQNPALRFWHWYSFSNGDTGQVQIKVKNGNWQPISSPFVNTSSGAWTNFFISLSAYADSTVQIAFYFHSQRIGSFGNVSTGWYIDSIQVDVMVGIDEIVVDNLPSIFELKQNYPNPFNPSTTIEFDLPKTSEVTLKIFNILGEEVAMLVSDRLSTGSYSYEWDASNLASGVYLYRLQAGEYVETRKMVLMR